MDIAEADAFQRLHLVAHRGHCAKKFRSLRHGQIEDVGDRLVLELDLERLAIIALAVAGIAGDIDIGKKMHLDLDDPIALAGLAAPALDVEGEAAGLIAARFGLREAGKPIADRGEGAGIGRGIRARRASDRRLVDVDDLVEKFEPIDLVMLEWLFARAHQLPGDGAIDGVDQQRGFAATRNAGDACEDAKRNLHTHILEVIGTRSGHFDAAALFRPAPAGGDGNLLQTDEILTGERTRIGHDLIGRALRHDFAAMDACTRADVDDKIGEPNGVLIMLNHDHGVADIAQTDERLQEPRIVALMEPDRRLVQHIEHAGEAGSDLRGQPDALAFAPRQRARDPRHIEIIEAHIDQEFQAGADLLQDAGGNLAILGLELRLEPAEPVIGGTDRHFRNLADMQFVDLDRQRLRFEAIAAAGIAGMIGLIA